MRNNIQVLDSLDQHFATLPQDDICPALQELIDRYDETIRDTGLLDLWHQSYLQTFKGLSHKGKLLKSGEQGEFTLISVNHYKSILSHKVGMTVRQRPTFEPRANNTDYRSQAQTILARGLLDYYMREKRMERVLKRATEFAVRYGEGWVRTEWDTSLGETQVTETDEEEDEREGDIRYEAFSPIDVIRDTSKESVEQSDWFIIRTYRNRYDLIAKFAEFDEEDESTDEEVAEELKQLKQELLQVASKDDLIDEGIVMGKRFGECDDIPVYEFYHKPTPAVPNGRYVRFVNDEILLLEGDLPYDEIPVYDIMSSEIDGTPFGYTIAFDMLPIQSAIDALHSSVVTNQKTFSIQQIAIPRAAKIDPSVLGDALSVIFYDPMNVPGGGKPEAINFTATPAEVFSYIQQLEQLMETLSGINSVTRGNPEASLKSGAALALVQSMAIENSIGLQQSYIALLEDVGTATINLLKDNAESKRVAQIVGVSNKSMTKEFSGEDLSEVNRVTVDVGSPLSRTTAGKLEILQTLMQIEGAIKTPEQALMVLQTGTLEPSIEGTSAELLLIRSENEKLGEEPKETDDRVLAIMTDDHINHIKAHREVLSNPEARLNEGLVLRTLEHINEHFNLLKQTEPAKLQMLGQPSLALPEMSTPGTAMGMGEVGEVMNAENPVMQAAGEVKMPNMPGPAVNPLTNEPFDPETGGL